MPDMSDMIDETVDPVTVTLPDTVCIGTPAPVVKAYRDGDIISDNNKAPSILIPS
ncbi:hypothetical protein CCP3SC1AL1_110005 [Gammaproteobacteria bacterium]